MFVKLLWGIRAAIYSLFTKIGLPSYIGKPIFIKKLNKLKLGKRVRIYPGLRAEVIDVNGEIEIGNNVSIGQNFHVISNDEKLTIGNNVVISGNVFISNCDHQYTEIDKYLYDQDLITKTTYISDDCFIGYGTVILPGTKLGKKCIVGANSVVKGEFEDYVVIAGVPAKVIKRFNFEKNVWEKA